MIPSTLRQLDIFAQMIASGAFVACARDLGLTPGEVVAEIDALEKRLGHRLFDRQGDMATLTQAGRKTVEAMQHLSEIAPDDWEKGSATLPDAVPPGIPKSPMSPPPEERASPAAPWHRAPARETITIAAHPAIFGHFQDALTAFEETSPQDVAITLDLDIHNAAQAIPALARGRVDIAYFYALGEPEGWPSRYAWSEQMTLYIGAHHRLAALDSVDHDDLAALAPVMLSDGNSLRPLIDDALAMAGITPADPVLETSNLYEIMVAVRDGAGYFAAFGPLARDFARMNGIRRLPLAFPLPAIDVRQATRAAVEEDSMLATLSEYLFR